ncbi:hypothetical protein [Mesorhizobium sp. LSJC264A00]|uniref:hypothetical protein n=1 Tax=unclassified Mesorhizobium TaxID=325217 RepID=UPI0012EC4EB1|nr:hypothetical protein [Mesorhizobium sp. LSJC264A00]
MTKSASDALKQSDFLFRGLVGLVFEHSDHGFRADHWGLACIIFQMIDDACSGVVSSSRQNSWTPMGVLHHFFARSDSVDGPSLNIESANL